MPMLILTLLLTQPSPAPVELNGLAAALRQETGAPGAAVAVECGAGFVEDVAGVRIQGQDAPIRPGDLWHIGSNTKAMTATLAARLVEDGLIRWDSTIEQVLGGADTAIHPELGAVTLADLLAHHGGLKPNAGLLTAKRLAGADADRDVVADRRAYADHVLAEPGGPRGEFLYSNAGYVVAALMLETAAGRPYEALMQEQVFGPLGMESAGWGPPGAPGQSDQPRGHRPGVFGGLSAREPGGQADNPPAMNSAGRAHMALEDLADFLRAHGERPAGYLTAQSWDRLQRPVGASGYALGWGVGEAGVLIHAGSNTMWFVQMAVDPNSGCVAAAGVNDGRIDTVRGPVRDALLEALDSEA
jgi:D-alanyl-D-alanine carboxypeptidase